MREAPQTVSLLVATLTLFSLFIPYSESCLGTTGYATSISDDEDPALCSTFSLNDKELTLMQRLPFPVLAGTAAAIIISKSPPRAPPSVSTAS